MTVSDRIRVKSVRLLSDHHYILKTTTFDWRRASREWQTQARETYDRGNADQNQARELVLRQWPGAICLTR